MTAAEALEVHGYTQDGAAAVDDKQIVVDAHADHIFDSEMEKMLNMNTRAAASRPPVTWCAMYFSCGKPERNPVLQRILYLRIFLYSIFFFLQQRKNTRADGKRQTSSGWPPRAVGARMGARAGRRQAASLIL